MGILNKVVDVKFIRIRLSYSFLQQNQITLCSKNHLDLFVVGVYDEGILYLYNTMSICDKCGHAGFGLFYCSDVQTKGQIFFRFFSGQTGVTHIFYKRLAD